MIRLALRWLLVALLLSLGAMAVASSASASCSSTADGGTCAYDAHGRTAIPTHTTTKRGPPVAYDRTTNDVIDRWSHSASAHPDGFTTPAATARTTAA